MRKTITNMMNIHEGDEDIDYEETIIMLMMSNNIYVFRKEE